ncbi:hypothetical protein J2W35_003309 [Variovorax boronicumulans]|uniref:phage tail protein n=1 Tax=Variovorax boronicumulans TaxID=436515 RepID=UPI00278B9F86|nr:phage tail protein [Variovorax boronicumulans]MDQ0082950.1 hypothetical protein [Variovorax boronicumulans]
MPQAIAYGLAAVFTSGVVTTAITLAAYAITLVGTLALSSYQKRKAERAARAQFDAAQVDRLANVPSTVAQRELVLGMVRKGGHVFFKTSVGQYKELFIMCVAMASHEIDAYEQIYLNDQPVEINDAGQVITAPYGRAANIDANEVLGGSTSALSHTPVLDSVKVTREFFGGIGVTDVTEFSVSGNVVTITEAIIPGQIYRAYYQYSGFNSFVRITKHLGSPGQAADGELVAMLGGVWTEAHRAAGVAYLVCQFAYNDGALPSGIPTVTARIRGAKVYDPRTGVTQWSEMPPLLMRHVMLHPQFGKRTSLTAAEDARIIAATNACALAVSYTGTDLVNLYRAAIVLPFGSTARDALDDLAQSMGGEWAYAAGEYFVRAGVYQLPVFNLYEHDLATVQRSNDGSGSQNPTTISPHRPRNEKFNMVAIRIWDQAANYVETPITPYRADALVADDGAEISQEVTMPGVFYAPQAFHIAEVMLRDSRDPLTVTLSFKMKAYPIELFDGVTLTIARYGWNAKEFRVMARTFIPDGRVVLTLKETTSAIFAIGGGFLPGGYAPNTGLPKPWEIYPPQILSISSGEDELIVQTDGTIVNGVRVTWSPILDNSVLNGGVVELRYRVLPDGPWISIESPGDSTQVKFTGVDDSALILVKVRVKNSLASSDWGVQQLHQVVGKTEPPPNIEDLTISGSVMSWTMPRRVPDLAGFVFRFQYGNNTDWGSAAALHNGLITESPYDLVTRPGGVVTIMGKAQDTSGNQSQVTANIVMNLGDSPIANVIEEWDFDALGWPYQPGEQSGWTLVGGKPTANALDSLYGTDDQSFYGADLDSFYEPSSYGQMVYVTQEIPIVSALAGSIMTLAIESQGTDLHIDYRLSGPGSLYGADNDPMYGPDADPFFDGPGAWQPWPGQLVAANEVYQFRVTIGAGIERGILQEMVLTIDAPDIEEEISDLAVAAGGTFIPYTKDFTVIKTIQITLQANGSGAITAESTKTPNLTPKVTAYNAAHTSVSGATVDITLKGY